MALGVRQQRLYKDLVTLYRPTKVQSPATGLLTAVGYELAESNVKCLYSRNDSTSGPTVVGRGEADNMFTHDEWHFQASQAIGENWLIKDATVDAHGDNVLTFGEYWVVIGEPKKIADRGGRRAGYVSVQANRHTTPHPGVP